MSFATCDLCDDNHDAVMRGEIRVLEPGLVSYGGRTASCGRVVTLKLFEDNTLVRSEVEQPGESRILIIDGGGSRRCALLGGNLAVEAAKNGWAGVFVSGCVRDVDEIRGCNVDVRGLATCPVKSVKKGQGERNVPVKIQGVMVHPGDWCYADNDGIIFSANPLIPHGSRQ
ncbi:hypothetical protein CLOM_g6013 [Closterium sp. NIES-68]|nr:hypothetical protein CLOM_g24390 [Closterium sp. NIES-68]GJP46771.1 hypothetical protein CLOM_g6013 [Closterium sp. NIES-68]GJP60730.1 hypothetical protein CLOP_g17956 [Closterium sp. NIES-67]GJP76841.1 hypothetical protein CLOP_g7293 [Closterium sp. NIES-67]